MSIEFLDPAHLKVPIREFSKDWMYQEEDLSRTEEYRPDEKRDYGFLDVALSSGSLVNINVPMVVGANGYTILVDASLAGVSATSSVNHATLLSCASFQACPPLCA
jgi:hypothetical protein